MFYEEKMIDGVLHWRGTPTGDWQPVSPRELAEKIDILRTRLAESEARAVAAEANDRRYRWLRKNVREELTEASCRGEHSEHKTQYVMPKLISWADFCGQITLDAAIDAAQEAEREADSD